MKNYEVTFIVDPVLSGEEIKATAQTYVDLLQNEDSKIVYVDEMGLRQLAYAINRRTSGVYYCIEFQTEDGAVIDKLELALRRDERIIRFLSIGLDKYGVKYNDDKRQGLIGKVKKKSKDKKDSKGDRDSRNRPSKPSTPKVKKAEPAKEEVAEKAEPVAEEVAEKAEPVVKEVAKKAEPVAAAPVKEEEE